MRRLNRRQFLSASAASGALLVAGRPLGALALPLQSSAGPAADRMSRLFPGTRLAHADMHNHSLLSDGDGDPEKVFGSMRGYGLDVAALTDHATTSKFAKAPCGNEKECHSLLGIDETSWERVRVLANNAQQNGIFTALRGFEWSSPTLGHMNVWFSETWVDPLHTAGTSTGEGVGQHITQEMPGLGPVVGPVVDGVVRQSPANGATMVPFYEWLKSDPKRPAVGGGADGIAGFNHPGREPGRFGYFKHDPALRNRIVSMEIFNRREDYLFEGYETGQASPLVECLDAGWRVGLIGVSDEHGTDWGNPGDGLNLKGRAGIYVQALTRDGVKDALLNRRFFATVIEGLRLDAGITTATGAAGRMGESLAANPGTSTFTIDIDRGADWVGRTLNVQVLTTGNKLPTIVHAQDFTVPSSTQPLPTITADLGSAKWAVLRITDPGGTVDKRAAGTPYAQLGKAVAYASPFFFG